MSAPKITAYLSPFCPWSPGVVQVLEKYRLDFDSRNIVNDPQAYQEMVQKSGQHSSPCVEVDGHMLADVGGDEVEAWLQESGILDGAVQAE